MLISFSSGLKVLLVQSVIVVYSLTLSTHSKSSEITTFSSPLHQQLNLAQQAINSGQYDEGYRKALSVRETAVIDNNKDVLADSLYSIGKTFYYLSDFESALNYYHQALKIYEHLGKHSHIASTLSNIGNTHIELEQFSIAFEFHNRAYQLLDKLNLNTKLKVLLNYGYTLHRINNPAESQQIFNELSKVFIDYPDSIDRIYYYLMKAEIDRDNNNLDSSFDMIEQAIKLSEQHDNKELLIAARVEKVESLIKANRVQNAIDLGLTLIDPIKQLNREDKLELIHQHLYRAYKAIGLNKQALEFFEMYHNIRAQRQAVKDKQFANILSIDRKLEEAKQAIKQEQANLKFIKGKHQLEVDRLTMWYLIAIGLLLVIVGFLIYRLLKVKNMLK